VRFSNKNKVRSTPLEKIRRSLLADRIKTSSQEAELLLEQITADTAKILGITETSLTPDIEFSGREMDLIFTINKQNTPKKS
jgi:glutamate dehydrogenase/leucine dehydrogenase